jgi:hypothetical protein
MIDEETVGQQREVTGETVVACDFCGRPVPRSALVRIAGANGQAEPVEALHVCDDCRARIEEGDVPFDEEVSAALQDAAE